MTSKLTTATMMLALCAIALSASVSGALGATGGASAPAPGTVGRVRPTGIATWFGPGFYGKKTACGQTLTPSVVGVANRTLPCGTLVRVTFQGHTLTVPVLDRGPYSHIANWDLTAGAAQALGVTETVRIATRVVGHTANVATLGAPPVSPVAALAGGSVAE
ncbi:MAG TPA: septal ring lytic transglycosylase RlpA family protein [Solirubrobacteraceae bacterium]|jgi:rare lipoprotein A (peptidoglycan hydrolase)|nr:septal ring lytic transglycosylase RlpA family protein [Solirubrobacteraceae bacterium]